jgi:WD40 repeat protein
VRAQASGDKNETYILDVRRPDVALHVLTHEPAHFHGRIEYVNGVSAAWCHHSHATLVTGSDDSLVRIWDVSRAQPEVARLRGHNSPVSCVAVSAEDELIASGGDEGKAVLYSRRTDAAAAYLVGREQDNVLLRQSREDEEREANR